jgi:hypothetical protein
MDASELRARACQEADELGPEPPSSEADLWREERWGAVVLLAGLADDDAELLREAANGVAAEWADREAARLLLDAGARHGCETHERVLERRRARLTGMVSTREDGPLPAVLDRRGGSSTELMTVQRGTPDADIPYDHASRSGGAVLDR